ncbi:hypothetical protein [uncultured Nitratireductor sp.]|uniref:hypothetical protein n=1 Tax=uncultured Nitratireductor sp. TaxID=520953 RepID=UPI0025FFC325|nr:hypothetical protein [uncultured Nitratireductor sp.]
MPLQNRVSPFGRIDTTPARGLFTGNRGVIHDPDRKALLRRRWTTKAWIVCVCAFRDRRRAVMGRNGPAGGTGWTELFFLDEVTALAAGHRPCFFCRRDAAKRFMACVREAEGGAEMKAVQADTILHAQRFAVSGKAHMLSSATVPDLPDGTVIAVGELAYALRDGTLREWRFEGYGAARSPDTLPPEVQLLTPPLSVSALRAGYAPVWHDSVAS